MRYLYLHGWCSSPQSAKAQFFQQRFAACNTELVIPDLNLPDFQTLTLSRQLEQCHALIQDSSEVTIIGSSFGALTALFLAENNPQIKRLLLLAPAMNFYHHALRLLGKKQHAQWQANGVLPVLHYADNEQRLLNYAFLEDLQDYQESDLQRPVTGLVFHGKQDEVIACADTQAFCAERPYLKFHALDADHSLGNVMETIWQKAEAFLEI